MHLHTIIIFSSLLGVYGSISDKILPEHSDETASVIHYEAQRLLPAPVSADLHSFVEVVKKIQQQKQYSELLTIIEAELAYKDLDDLLISHSIQREIGAGFQQLRLHFITAERDEYYHFSLVKNEETLVFGTLMQGKRKREIVFSEAHISKYLDYFNHIFGTDKKRKDFRKEIDSIWMFSSGCGFSVEPTTEWTRLEKYVNSRQIDKVREFLYSMDVESQTYGLIGMKRLAKQGIEIPEKDAAIVRYLVSQNRNVYTCMGCIIGEVIGMSQLAEWES